MKLIKRLDQIYPKRIHYFGLTRYNLGYKLSETIFIDCIYIGEYYE